MPPVIFKVKPIIFRFWVKPIDPLRMLQGALGFPRPDNTFVAAIRSFMKHGHNPTNVLQDVKIDYFPILVNIPPNSPIYAKFRRILMIFLYLFPLMR